MADKNLSDDMVKLVEYTIVTIKRSDEDIIHSGKKLVTDNMTGEAFASWMVSENGPDSNPNDEDGEDQYLRVYYNVLDRWPKQDLKYEEKQLEILGGIKKVLS